MMVMETIVVMDPRAPEEALTVGKLRELIDGLPGDSLVEVGVRDAHRFNTLVGELSVRGGSVFAGVDNPILVLTVAGF